LCAEKTTTLDVIQVVSVSVNVRLENYEKL